VQLRSIASILACSTGLALVSALGAGACSSTSDTPPPVGDTGVSDTKGGDANTNPTKVVSVLNDAKTDDIEADLSCMGKPVPDAGPPADAGDDSGDADPDAPVATGTLIDVPFKVTQFGGGGSDIVVGAKVDFFYKDTLVPDVADLSGTTDAKGIFLAKLPAGLPFAYRVNANDKLRTFVDYSSVAPGTAGKQFEGTAITISKYDQFALAITGKVGFLTAAGTGIFSARVKDCKSRDVQFAVVSLVDGDTGLPLPTGPGDADLKPIHYLTDAELPSNGATWTSRSGLIAAINVPKTGPSKKIKAIASGLFGGSTEMRKFAEADLEITAEAVNFRYVPPK